MIDDNAGNTTVTMAMVIIILMAMCGIIIDLGVMVEHRARLYSASMAGAHSSIDSYDVEILEREGVIELIPEVMVPKISSYLTANLEDAWVDSVELVPERHDCVRIITKCKVKPVFMQLFGVDEKVMKVDLFLTVYPD
ncbi:MAG: hypothetical protein K6D96_02665 [Acetatifactor sp.]|nr:hypothetical protein [Acetatifactor sp.]